MKLQDQCATLEQCKRLKELGIEQGYSYFEYAPNDNIYHDVVRDNYPGTFNLFNIDVFTATELGVILPAGCISCYNDHHGFWVCEFIEPWDKDEEPDATPYAVPGWKLTASIGDDEPQTEAEARAAMLIYLLENNLTTASECNKRLTT